MVEKRLLVRDIEEKALNGNIISSCYEYFYNVYCNTCDKIVFKIMLKLTLAPTGDRSMDLSHTGRVLYRRTNSGCDGMRDTSDGVLDASEEYSFGNRYRL